MVFFSKLLYYIQIVFLLVNPSNKQVLHCRRISRILYEDKKEIISKINDLKEIASAQWINR